MRRDERDASPGTREKVSNGQIARFAFSGGRVCYPRFETKPEFASKNYLPFIANESSDSLKVGSSESNLASMQLNLSAYKASSATM